MYQDEDDSISHNGDDQSSSHYALLNEEREQGIHEFHPAPRRGRDNNEEDIHTEFV